LTMVPLPTLKRKEPKRYLSYKPLYFSPAVPSRHTINGILKNSHLNI
jgi:hypothetical protein